MIRLFGLGLILLLTANPGTSIEEASQDVYLNLPRENLRLTPNGKKIGTILHGTQLEEIETKGNWVHVRTEGWIWKQSLSAKKPAPLEKNKKPLVIESWKWVNSESPLQIKLDGIVRNNSNSTFDSVKMFITARDANGNFLGTATAKLQTDILPEGSSTIFTAVIEDAICPTSTIDISYKFEIR